MLKGGNFSHRQLVSTLHILYMFTQTSAVFSSVNFGKVPAWLQIKSCSLFLVKNKDQSQTYQTADYIEK